MIPDVIMQWAAENCPYKSFKWHTEEMCDNCREVAKELQQIVFDKVKKAEEKQEARSKIEKAEALKKWQTSICRILDGANDAEEDRIKRDFGFFSKLFGKTSAALEVVGHMRSTAKRIMEAK